MISNDPTPIAKVFRKVTNPVHPWSVSLGASEWKDGRRHTQNKITLVRQWMHVYKTNERGTCDSIAVGDEETLPEWLGGKGIGATPQGI